MDIDTIRAWLADPSSRLDEACGYVADLLAEVDRMAEERAELLVPVEEVDIAEILRAADAPARTYTDAEDRAGTLAYAAPILAREVVRMRYAAQRVPISPSALLFRVKALGYVPGGTPEGVLPWLVGKAEEMRAEQDAFATYREMTTTALGVEPSSCAEDVAEAVNEMRAGCGNWQAVATVAREIDAQHRGGCAMADDDLVDVVARALRDFPKLAEERAASADLRHEIDALRRERHAERQRVQERDAEIAEMRLTLAAEQGKAEGAPSEGWACGAGEVRWGKHAGGDEDTYGIGMLVEQIWSAFVLRGWRWKCSQQQDRGPSILIVEGVAPTARAAMLAADKALETP